MMRKEMTASGSAVPSAFGVLALLFGGFLAAGACLAAQNPPPHRQPRAKKVWTEDDLLALRTPADLHERRQAQKAEAERAAREAEEAARKDAAAHPLPPDASGTTGPETAKPDTVAPAGTSPPSIPTRIEDVQKRIEVVRRQVADLEFEVRAADQALREAGEDHPDEAAKRSADATDRLNKARAELDLLEARLRDFKPTGS